MTRVIVKRVRFWVLPTFRAISIRIFNGTRDIPHRISSGLYLPLEGRFFFFFTFAWGALDKRSNYCNCFVVTATGFGILELAGGLVPQGGLVKGARAGWKFVECRKGCRWYVASPRMCWRQGEPYSTPLGVKPPSRVFLWSLSLQKPKEAAVGLTFTFSQVGSRSLVSSWVRSFPAIIWRFFLGGA